MSDSPMDRLGSLEREGDAWRLRFVRRLPHAPERVWRALTDPAELAAWFPTSIDGERRAGAALRFTFPADQAPPFDGVMVVCDPPRVMELMWGPDRIRFELVATADGTELTLLDTLEAQGKAARDAAGWHVCLESFVAALGDPVVNPVTWREVHALYVELFGAEAATIGPPSDVV